MPQSRSPSQQEGDLEGPPTTFGRVYGGHVFKDRYALSPMQAGMLYTAVMGTTDASARGFDIEQLHIELNETIDVMPFTRAWSFVVGRHPILSSSFVWQGVKLPFQRVERGVAVRVDEVDLRGLTEEERQKRIAAFLQEDRAKGLDPGIAPLMRLTVFDAGAARSDVVWTFHHILLDGRSFAAVLNEVFEAYNSFRRAGRVSMAPPTRPYADYIAWLGNCDFERSREYFRNLLQGFGPPTPLPGAEPATRPLPALGYSEIDYSVGASALAGARALVAASGTTLATVVQAAWALVLSRYSGSRDVVFGGTRACRRSVLDGDGDGMVGLFMNTLPVRARLEDELTVGALLTSLREQSLALREHEHTPLVDVQKDAALGPGTALFESLVMFENRELSQTLRGFGPQWKDRKLTLHEQPTPPLNVTVFDGDGLLLRVLFDRRRFRQHSAERVVEALATALTALGAGLDAHLGDLEVLSAAAQQQIVRGWNETELPFEDQVCIHQPFERWVNIQPEAVALVMGERSLTYAELDTASNQLAHALVAKGAGPGRFVAVCLERSIELVVALIAVVKAGAAYVPLDPTYPEDRIEFMLSDADALLVITETAFAARFSKPVLVLDGSDAAEVARQAASRPALQAEPSDRCYAIFTSGSTGQPKGVVLTHRAVINTCEWVTRTFELAPGDRLLFVTSPCFDLSVYDVFGGLGAGATVVVASTPALRDPALLAGLVFDHGITVWNSAPAVLKGLVPTLAEAKKTGPLRLVLLSGDWIHLTLPDAIRAVFPGAKVVSLGGATEAAIWSNFFVVEQLDSRWTSVPYGRPIQNAVYHVLDNRLRPVPVGVAGDLYIGGMCLAEGYLNRPQLTRERFIADPFRAGTEQRLYHTGDLARYFDDGNLELLGRSDFQVKIRGYRVELGEVETVLLTAPKVREAVCAAFPDASGLLSLVAYLVMEPGASLDEARLRDHVRARLPDFMVPSRAVALAALPLSSNGKIDRKALPALTARPAQSQAVEPRTDLERSLVALWEELLNRTPIGVEDDFFALGGHSLLAVLFVSRLKSELDLTLPITKLLEYRTIAALAELLDAPLSVRARYVVGLGGGKQGTALVFVAGVGGYAFTYKDLPEKLGSDYRVYGLQAVGADPREELTYLTIEQMADAYEAELNSRFPDGPLLLGGFSFGMLPAFEVAHRLLERGRQVPLLISFDGFAPGWPPRAPAAWRALSHLKTFMANDSEGRTAYVKERVSKAKLRVMTMLGRGHELAPESPFADPEMAERMQRLWVHHMAARNEYRPGYALPIPLLLIRAEQPERWPATVMDDPYYGWTEFISGPIELVEVPGKHTELFAPKNIERIVASIRSRVPPPRP